MGNFVELARKGFYDNLKFHRYVPGFVIQGGCPTSTRDLSPEDAAKCAGNPYAGLGTGGPGYSIKEEYSTSPHNSHEDGALAMARSQNPDSAGSQFYFCLGAQHMLDSGYTVFGQTIEGMDVIGQLRVGDVIEHVEIENAAEQPAPRSVKPKDPDEQRVIQSGTGAVPGEGLPGRALRVLAVPAGRRAARPGRDGPSVPPDRQLPHQVLKDPGEAIHAYTQATADASYDACGSVNYNLGMAYAALHDYENAVRHFEISVSDAKYDTPYKAYIGMGNALMKLGKSAEAGVAFREAALDEGNPDPTKALLNLGVCFMALNRPVDAVASDESALDSSTWCPTSATSFYANLGQAYVASGQMQKAVNAFEQAISDKTYFLSDSAERRLPARGRRRRPGHGRSASRRSCRPRPTCRGWT